MSSDKIHKNGVVTQGLILLHTHAKAGQHNAEVKDHFVDDTE